MFLRFWGLSKQQKQALILVINTSYDDMMLEVSRLDNNDRGDGDDYNDADSYHIYENIDDVLYKV